MVRMVQEKLEYSWVVLPDLCTKDVSVYAQNVTSSNGVWYNVIAKVRSGSHEYGLIFYGDFSFGADFINPIQSVRIRATTVENLFNEAHRWAMKCVAEMEVTEVDNG